MKKIFVLLLALVMMFSMLACGNNANDKNENENNGSTNNNSSNNNGVIDSENAIEGPLVDWELD